MRALASVALKIFGVTLFYSAATYVLSILSFFSMAIAGRKFVSASWDPSHFVAMGVVSVVIMVGALLSAWMLTFRTGWVVTKLQIPDEPFHANIPPSALLRIGLIVVGVSELISAFSDVGYILYSAMVEPGSSHYGWSQWGRMTSDLAKILLSFIVIGISAGISNRAFPGVDREGERIDES